MNLSYVQSDSRHKAVWGPKRIASALLVAFACVRPNVAVADTHSNHGSHKIAGGSHKTAGVPGAFAKPYKLDVELTRRASERNGANRTRVIVTLIPGAELPAEFRKYFAQHQA